MYGVGALHAAARGDRMMWALHRAALSNGIVPVIPAVAVAAYELDKQLVLGLPAQDMVLLALTLLLGMLTLGSGRTNILFGLVHLVVFAVFVFLVFVP